MLLEQLHIAKFFKADSRDQSLMFPIIRKGIKSISRNVLWKYFKNNDSVLVDECTSHILETLNKDHVKIQTGKDNSYIYSLAKAFCLDAVYRKNKYMIFVDNLFEYNIAEEESEDEYLNLKIETVAKLRALIRFSNDKNSLLVVSALIEMITKHDSYNYVFVSLFLYRSTNLNFKQIHRTLIRLDIKVKISREEIVYKTIENCKIEIGTEKIITDSEMIAIEKYITRKRNENYENTNFIISDERKRVNNLKKNKNMRKCQEQQRIIQD